MRARVGSGRPDTVALPHPGAGDGHTTIVQRQAEQILVKADLTPGDLIVTEGVQSMRPGVAVKLLAAEALATDARAALRGEG